MADDWIQIRTSLHEDPSVMGIADRLGISTLDVVGRVVRIWSWADTHLTDGNAPSVTFAHVDALVACAGFAQAMLDEGWLSHNGDGISIPKWDAYLSKSAKNRALAARRARKHREKCVTVERDDRNGARVTKTLPEKRREEKSKKTTSSSPLTPQGDWEIACSAMTSDVLKTDEFRNAWIDWIADRKDRKKAPTTRAITGQIHKLEAWGHDRAIEAIRTSIDQGWTGLFEPKASRGQSQGPRTVSRRPTAAERGEYEEPDTELPFL